MAAWDDALDALLTEADTVCALDADAVGWLRQRAIAVATEGTAGRLALGLSALDGLDRVAARALLFHARTYLAPTVLVVASERCALSRDEFRALAFEPLASAGGTTLYQFNLATYKPVPDWLNPRFWAHPERWKP